MLHTKETKEAISREFGGLEIVDAEYDIRLVIMEPDVQNAKRTDFGRCVFANACKRQFGSNKVLFMRSVAYISIQDEDGNMRIERFIISPKGQELIKKFDKGENIEAGCAFVIRAPSETQRLEYQRQKQEQYRERQNKKKTVSGIIKGVDKIKDGVSDLAAQEKEIALYFLENPDSKIGPGELHKQEEYGWPLTSTRRAIKNLTDAGIIKKTDGKKMGQFGRRENLWMLNSISKKIVDDLIDIAKQDESTIQKMRVEEYQVRNGTGVIQMERSK